MGAGKVLYSGSPVEVFSQVALLKELGLDVPLAAEIAKRLRENGIDLPENIITDEELAVALCP
jgi:energy-coupling factor transport system ATP-binding protein